MGMQQSKSKGYRAFVLVLISAVLLAALVVLAMLTRVHPIQWGFAEDQGVLIDCQYIDYMGHQHSGLISDRAAIRELSEILKGIQEENPKRIIWVEEKCGPVPFMFLVKRGSKTLHYSLKGEYLAVGERGFLKTYTIYQLSSKSSERLLNFLWSACE